MLHLLSGPAGQAFLMSLGAFVYSWVEYALPRMKNIKARSFWEAFFNIAGMAWPWLKKFGTPDGNGRLELPAEVTKKSPPPTPGKVAAILFTIGVGVAFALAISGCAGTTPYTVYSTTLSGLERADSAAMKSFEQFNTDYQLSIVEQDRAAGHPERADTDLATYRQKRLKVIAAQSLVSSLIRGANALLPLVQAKKATIADINKVLQQVVAASAEFEAALGEMTGTTKVVTPPSAPTTKPASRRDPGDQWPGWAMREAVRS